MADEKRRYRMKKRAEQQEETRRRIVESAVHLHGSVGPSNTPMSAIADHAGVPRSTLYRHFPDEAAVFEACSGHWIAQNPLPDPGSWAQIDDPHDRLVEALSELYPYYRRTRGMLENLFRDEPVNDLVRRHFGGVREYIDGVVVVLSGGRSGDPVMKAALGHVVSFGTWRSLAVEQDLDDDAAAALAVRFVEAAASLIPAAARTR